VPIDKLDPAANPRLGNDIPKITALLAAQPLYARVASSSAIVTATVTQIVAEVDPCDSEHCPEWTTADLAPQDALCGDDSAEATAFPASIDIAWAHAPKLTVGQQAVLLLHHPAARCRTPIRR
jgi:hypothetical protein